MADDRFTIYLNVNPSGGSTLAFFSIIDNKLGIRFNDFRLVKAGSGDVFISSPSKKYFSKKENKDKWTEFVSPIKDHEVGQRYWDEILRVATQEFQQKQETGTQRAAQAAVSARGPAKAAVDDDDELPF